MATSVMDRLEPDIRRLEPMLKIADYPLNFIREKIQGWRNGQTLNNGVRFVLVTTLAAAAAYFFGVSVEGVGTNQNLLRDLGNAGLAIVFTYSALQAARI
ncbi:hypothetical protein HYS91_05350 [Candidatus Daviesbacteria bacterium]|nr:hypothetical protein [Candidatus Daviesbacteria bacterium]